MKWIIHFLFVCIYILITFFGLGPVLLADGSSIERLITVVIVIGIYVAVTLVYRFTMKKIGNKH